MISYVFLCIPMNCPSPSSFASHKKRRTLGRRRTSEGGRKKTHWLDDAVVTPPMVLKITTEGYPPTSGIYTQTWVDDNGYKFFKGPNRNNYLKFEKPIWKEYYFGQGNMKGG